MRRSCASDSFSDKTSSVTVRNIQLDEIALQDLSPFKVTLKRYGRQDHSRWVFRGAAGGMSDNYFYKIWNPSYVRRDNILAAIASGFYDERTVSALHAVILHKGICRGYVMHEGEPRADAFNDEFRKLVYSRTRETGFFAAQFGRNHTMIYRGKRSFFDIEGVYPLDALPRLPQYWCRDTAYVQWVAGLWQSSPASRGFSEETVARIAQVAAGDTIGMPKRRGRLQRFCLRSSRRAIIRIRNLVPRTDLIQF